MRKRPNDQAGVVTGLFRDLFECDGQPFGSPSLGVLGISDGIEGVQWNAWYSQREETAWWLGVNLEGKKYDGWPIARLVKREISRPLLLTDEYRVRKPECVTVKWTRDVWQFGNRVRIKESWFPRPIALDQLDSYGWKRRLECALGCLDSKREYLGRRRTEVTPGQMRDVSPHLQFKTWLNESTPHAMQRAKDNLEALHEWVTRQARPLKRL